jgi:predicted RNA binding protein with dsRBD fold (UPF0201 family)
LNVNVTTEAAVEPTEDEKKVERALLRVFPSGRTERRIEEDVTVGLVVHGSGLEFLSSLRNLIRQERIRNTARAIFMRSSQEPVLHIHLNKQAAFMGRISFCAPYGESPHGPISVTVESDEMQSVIDYLATSPPGTVNPEVRRRRKPSPYPEEE